MKVYFILLCLFSAFVTSAMSLSGALAAPPQLKWAKGQGTSLGEHVIEGVQTDDGGGCLVGKTDEPGRQWADGFVIKLDAQGNCQWEYTYHRPAEGHNACEWVIPLYDGGYLMLLDSDHLGDAEEGNVGLLKLDKAIEGS